MSFVQGHALIIGVGSYQYCPNLDVPITVADAWELGDVLRDPRSCGYPEAQVGILHDAVATRAAILQALDALAARTTEQDTVLLFYCGHGDYGEDGQYYLTSYDTRVAGGKIVAGAGVSQQELLARLQAIRAGRVLLLFNACHAGAVVPSLGAPERLDGRNPPEAVSGALLATGAGRVIITACRASQVAYIGGGARTLFAQVLVDGLRGAGVSDRAGYISAFDLYSYVYTTVNAQVRASFQAVQEPELTILKGVGPFAVALYPGAGAPGDFDAQARPAAGPAVREVDLAESRALLQRIQHGGVDFGSNNAVTIHGGVADTIDRRQGVSISGGTVSGTIVGFNHGSIAVAGAAQPADPLQGALARVEGAAAQAQQRGEDDLALDLQSVTLALRAALKAQQEAKTERRRTKLREAHAALRDIAAAQPALAEVVDILEGQL